MKSSMNSEFCPLGDFKQPLEQPHQFIQIFYLFYTKKPTFSIYTSTFTKYSYQFIYSTHLFNKIFIILQFFIIYSLTASLSHRPTVPSLPTITPHPTTIITTQPASSRKTNPLNPKPIQSQTH